MCNLGKRTNSGSCTYVWSGLYSVKGEVFITERFFAEYLILFVATSDSTLTQFIFLKVLIMTQDWYLDAKTFSWKRWQTHSVVTSGQSRLNQSYIWEFPDCKIIALYANYDPDNVCICTCVQLWKTLHASQYADTKVVISN